MNIKEEQDAINKLALNEWKEVKKDFVETTDRIKDFCEYKINESSISACKRCKEATVHVDQNGKSICTKCNTEGTNEWVATPENEEKVADEANNTVKISFKFSSPQSTEHTDRSFRKALLGGIGEPTKLIFDKNSVNPTFDGVAIIKTKRSAEEIVKDLYTPEPGYGDDPSQSALGEWDFYSNGKQIKPIFPKKEKPTASHSGYSKKMKQFLSADNIGQFVKPDKITPENEGKKADPSKCKICGKPSNPEWSAEDGEYCSKECLMTYSGKVEEEKAAIITVGSTAKLIKEDMGAKGNVDLEIGDKKYNFDYDVDYKWSGKYHPASMSGPEEFPELEILNIAYSDITEYGVDVDKKVKWEEIPEDIRKAIDEKFGDKWLEDFVEEEQDYDPD